MTAPSAVSTWAELVRTALVGTERASGGTWRTADAGAPFTPLLAALATGDAEADLLAAAALLVTYTGAGRLPARAPRDLPEPAPSDEDDLPLVSARAERTLWSMLAGAEDQALPEWLGLAARRGRRAPALALPALLAAATRQRALREPVRAALGARGRWLASRNPEWAWASQGEPPVDEGAVRALWETGTPDERRALLDDVRRRDPARARALVESTWAADAPAQRGAFVAALRPGLGAADEPLLERALDDRRQEVRRAAATLLGALASSALVSRMTERARRALRHDPGGLLRRARLEVEPPSAHDSAMERDGVDLKAPAGIGERAWWLAQILAAVPPRTWSDAWRAEADALVRLASGGEWARALLDGWSAAAVRFADAAWAEALLRAPSPGPHATPVAASPAQLLGVLPPERREALGVVLLRERGRDAVALDLVLAADHAWSDNFARAVLDWLRRRMRSPIGASAADDWRLRGTLPQLALRFPVRHLTLAADGWPTDAETWPSWAAPVERFVALLTFRRELTEAFDR